MTSTTPLERQTIAAWIREVLTDEEEEVSSSQRKAYGKFLLDLEKDTTEPQSACIEGRTGEGWIVKK